MLCYELQAELDQVTAQLHTLTKGAAREASARRWKGAAATAQSAILAIRSELQEDTIAAPGVTRMRSKSGIGRSSPCSGAGGGEGVLGSASGGRLTSAVTPAALVRTVISLPEANRYEVCSGIVNAVSLDAAPT
jgi:hypothetical protein